MSDENSQSNYWLDILAREISEAQPKGEIIVSTGLSPSGFYHLGSTREPVTAAAVTWALRKLGRKVRNIYFSDDFDVLRKIPDGLPDRLEANLGQPLYLAPSPGKGANNYADYFDATRASAMAAGGFEPDEIVRARDAYPAGTFTKSIEQALSKLDQVRQIIAEVGGRQLPPDWAPVQLLDDDGYLNRWKYTGWDAKKQMISYVDADGKTGELDYTKGRVKLDWRLDWPARWAIWGVAVEPFGRDHATKGGSYDTGKVLVEEIFGGKAPFPIPYEFIVQAGETKKMSKSKGSVVTAQDALDIMPPEVFRYFIVRSRPAKTLKFDTGLALSSLIDEFAAADVAIANGLPHDFADAYKFAVAERKQASVIAVPFSHLVTTYQTAGGDSDKVVEILERTGHPLATDQERQALDRELGYVANWLKNYAPDNVKFQVQSKLPKADLAEDQVAFLTKLAYEIQRKDGKEIDGPAMHQLIYDAKESAKVSPQEAFSAIYRVVLGQDSGPKAGWFLAGLDRDWLIKRLQRTA